MQHGGLLLGGVSESRCQQGVLVALKLGNGDGDSRRGRSNLGAELNVQMTEGSSICSVAQHSGSAMQLQWLDRKLKCGAQGSLWRTWRLARLDPRAETAVSVAQVKSSHLTASTESTWLTLTEEQAGFQEAAAPGITQERPSYLAAIVFTGSAGPAISTVATISRFP